MTSPTTSAPRVALVTGGGRGIGRAIALALAGDRIDVAVAARSSDQVAAVADEVRQAGVRAVAIELDVTDPEQVATCFATVRKELGEPLILVNNAGVANSAKFIDTDPETWAHILDVNLTGPYHCTQAALPAMLDAGSGRVINIASTAAKTGYPYTSAYSASKHGLLGLTRSLALEVAGSGITVNAVCPGFTRTDIVDQAVRRIVEKTGRSVAEAEKELMGTTPAGRFIEPEEVARLVAFLAGEGGNAINGQGLNIDGGAVLD